jgi:hypothetical protein
MRPGEAMDDDDPFGEADGPAPRIQGFKEEMRQMPALPRLTIYLSLACMVLLFVQCIFIMPVILIKYGWGYGGGFVR